MVDYTINLLTFKNYFDNTECDINYGFVDYNGVWYESNFFGYCFFTFLERVNVCEEGTAGIKGLTSGSVSLYPNPSNDAVNIVSTNDIRSIEALNYLGQSIYKSNDVNLKSTKLDVAGFNAGEYFVKIITVSGINIEKITVIH